MSIVQRAVASSPALTRFLMTRVPPSVHERQGVAFAARVLKTALDRTVAYPSFLAESGITADEALRIPFSELPLTSKHNYIDRFPLRDRCLDGALHHAYVIERSSGHSGTPYYWPRTPEEDRLFPLYAEMGFRTFYGIDTTKTLIIVTLALGTWTSGERVSSALRQMGMSGKRPVTVVTPGVDQEEILQLVRDLSPEYEQTILIGYPPFIRALLDEGAARGMDWTRYHIRLGLGGEGYPEEWRERVAERLGLDPNDLGGISSGYGAADIGTTIGREHPVTVLIRRLCRSDPALCRDLFGRDFVPNLFQYNPGTSFAEEIDGELVFTVFSAVPLVRYAIHDLGGVMGFEPMLAALAAHGYDVGERMSALGYAPDRIWRLPFLYCYGRGDGTVTVGGVNVYPESITAILGGAGDTDILGHKLSVEDDRLCIYLEHRASDIPPKRVQILAERYHLLIVEGLLRVNAEYRRLYAANSSLADPVVRVFSAGTGPFIGETSRIKRRYRMDEGHPQAA